MGQTGTNLLDTIGRVYKNSDGKILGMHCISVQSYTQASPDGKMGSFPDLTDRRSRSVHISSTFQRFNFDIGGSRVVSTVSMFGGYDDFVENGSNDDILTVTYSGRDTDGVENDLIVSMDEFPTIGATL